MPYIYQADLYCDHCGTEIREALDRQDKTPPNASDETTYDSDDYPKYVSEQAIGESDSPDHCGCGNECLNAIELPSGGKIGYLIHDRLTEDGVDYVKDAIAMGGEVADVWAKAFADYL